jgi:hypothetical protein
MSWKYKMPERRDFDTDEEYQEELDAYYAAEDNYADACMEKYYDR